LDSPTSLPLTSQGQRCNRTTIPYDDADRLISVTDAAGHVTSYAYDTENNLTCVFRAIPITIPG
jgi:YD repeat-containing protein